MRCKPRSARVRIPPARWPAARRPSNSLRPRNRARGAKWLERLIRMSAAQAPIAPGAAISAAGGAAAKDHAAAIAEHFRQYNEEFGRITRRAALNFLAEDWHSA